MANMLVRATKKRAFCFLWCSTEPKEVPARHERITSKREVGYIGEKDRPSRHPADATLPFRAGKNELPYGMN